MDENIGEIIDKKQAIKARSDMEITELMVSDSKNDQPTANILKVEPKNNKVKWKRMARGQRNSKVQPLDCLKDVSSSKRLMTG